MAAKISNIVFDCENPRELSHFWADVLGYPRADYPEEMRAALLSAGLSEDDLAARSVAIDPTGESPRLFFQRVPEGKVAKNRVHIDVNATPGRRAAPAEVDAEVERVVALGGTVLHRVDSLWGPYPEYHYVLADPEGNEFCIQ